MTNEESVQGELVQKFGFLENKIKIQRKRRITVEVEMQNFKSVFEYCIDELKFCILCTMTGLDETDKFAIIYHIAREDGTILNIKTWVPRDNPAFKTITGHFPAAEIYERELVDLFGMKAEGLPEGRRYPLPDDWPAGEHPLRKDWKGSTPLMKEGEKHA